MNARKTIGICVVALVLMGSAAACAGDVQGRGGGRVQGGPESMGGGPPPALPDSAQIAARVDELARTLALSAGQKERVSALHFAHFDEARARMNERSGTREDHRKKMESLRNKFEAEVKALLTEQQRVAFDKLARNRRPEGRR